MMQETRHSVDQKAGRTRPGGPMEAPNFPTHTPPKRSTTRLRITCTGKCIILLCCQTKGLFDRLFSLLQAVRGTQGKIGCPLPFFPMSRPRQPGLRSAEGSTRASHPPFDVLNNAVAVMMHRGSLTMVGISFCVRARGKTVTIVHNFLTDFNPSLPPFLLT